MPDPVRLVVADDHPVFRAGIRVALETGGHASLELPQRGLEHAHHRRGLVRAVDAEVQTVIVQLVCYISKSRGEFSCVRNKRAVGATCELGHRIVEYDHTVAQVAKSKGDEALRIGEYGAFVIG